MSLHLGILTFLRTIMRKFLQKSHRSFWSLRKDKKNHTELRAKSSLNLKTLSSTSSLNKFIPDIRMAKLTKMKLIPKILSNKIWTISKNCKYLKENKKLKPIMTSDITNKKIHSFLDS